MFISLIDVANEFIEKLEKFPEDVQIENYIQETEVIFILATKSIGMSSMCKMY